jgi:quercetin dioxygenase-like cupin family protein
MRLRSFVAGSAVLALAASGLAGSTALATPGAGTTTQPPAPIPEYTLDGPVRASSDGIKLKTKDDAVVRTFTLTYASGGYSGWHAHPGIVLAVVQSGTVKRKLPCEPAKTFTAGQAFTEVGPHYVFNADKTPNGAGTPAVLQITQIAPADTTGPAFREDLPAPRCHPRT